MNAVHFDFAAAADGSLEDGWGGSLTISDDGLVTRNEPVHIRAQNPELHLPAKGTAHPLLSLLKLTSAGGQRVAHDTWSGQLTYKGVQDIDTEVHTYAFDGDTQQPHITTHPEYEETLAPHATKDSNGKFQYFPDTGGALTNHLTGITSYHDPTLVFKHVIVKVNSGGGFDTQLEFENVGKIFTTDDINLTCGGGDLPVPTIDGANAGIRDWLLLRPSIEILGGALRITRNYILSGPHGWNSLIYDAYDPGP